MNLEDKVCSREQAQKLIKLGITLNTFWYWGYQGDLTIAGFSKALIDDGILFPAPSVAELGMLLPWVIHLDDGSYIKLLFFRNEDGSIAISIFKAKGGWKKSNRELLKFIQFQPEPHARAEALLWLIDNGFVKPKELKL